MEIIVHEISRLERILDEMLDFPRPVKLNLKPLLIRHVIDGGLEIMEAKMRERDILSFRRIEIAHFLSEKISFLDSRSTP